jgi:flagellin-like hook-associated protein FlgL
MQYTNPLDFLITESVEEEGSPLFGESSAGEVELPGSEDADIDSMEFDFSDIGDESASEEVSEIPAEEEHEDSGDTRDIISELKKKISDLKEEITEKLKPLFPEDKESDKELAEALDDATSALDLCDHHLTDIDNALSDRGSEPEEIEETPAEEANETPAEEAEEHADNTELPLEGME